MKVYSLPSGFRETQGGFLRWSGGCTAAAICMLAASMFPAQAPAVELFPAGSEVTGHLDTTVSTGIAVRTRGRASDLVGVSNGGKANSINEDDGNLNYDKGDVVSANVKVTHELDIQRDNLGLFLRAYYFHDQAVTDADTARTRLSGKAKRYAGSDIKLLDAYVSGHFNPGGTPVSIRAGNQVINWGESVFLRHGLSSINPVDVSKVRVAGAELRDVLEPVPALNLSVGLTDNLSVEAFYQFRFAHTEIEPAGTFFSTNDFASPGGRIAHTGFGVLNRANDNDGAADPSCPGLCSRAVRAGDRDAGDDGQFGVTLRYFSPVLNNIELGLHFARIHSRLPVVSLRAGSLAGLATATGYTGTVRYFREFPEDIDLMGLSFNTELGTTGFAIQGEVSYRRDQPLQIDGAELFFSALSPLRDAPVPQLAGLAGLGTLLSEQSQTGRLNQNQELAGYRRKDVLQGTLALTRALGPRLGANQTVFLIETGFTQIQDMEKKSELRYEGPGTWTSANPAFTSAGVQPATQRGGFADPFSWGYRLLMRATYSNAVGPVNLSPEIAFAHDVNGTTPSPIGNFVEDRKTITLALNASYLHSWQARLSYTNSFDAGPHNLLRDRDFLSLTLNYSF